MSKLFRLAIHTLSVDHSSNKRYIVGMQDTYTEGFLDGMRYSGRLLYDVEDINLDLSQQTRDAILNGFVNRNYTMGSRGRKLHGFIKRLVEDTDRLYEENTELRELLKQTRQELGTVDKPQTD